MKELKNIPGLEPEQIVKLRKFNYGDKSKLVSKCLSLNLNTQKPEFDLESYRLYALYYGLIEAPFLREDKIKSIEEISPETGEFLFTEIVEYNNMGEKRQDLTKK